MVETHPVQYHAPVYRAVQTNYGIPVTVVYGSDHSVVGYRDEEFGAEFAWDTNLLEGYESRFLTRGQRETERISASKIRAALAAVSPDAVLNVGYSPAFYRKALRVSTGLGKPLMFRAETTDHAQSRGPLRAILRDRFLKRIYGHSSALLYIGEHSRQHYQRLGVPPQKLIFSPYCVDTSVFQPDEESRRTLRPEARSVMGIPDQRVVLLFSGKLSARKGVDLLIDAVKRLDSSIRDNVTVVFLGAGEKEADLKTAAANEPLVDARFIGFQNQSQLSRYYHAADLLVLPSVTGETWGLVVNEAMHHGLPALVSDDVGCAPDLIERGTTGAVFASNSVTTLTESIEMALPLVGREQIRDNCRRRIDRYTVDAAAKGIADAFESVKA